MARSLRKIDFRQTHRELYRATRSVQEVEAGQATFLAFDGVGPPGGQAYQEAIGKLYAMVYTTKFSLKYAGVLDFAIPNVECLWHTDPTGTPKSQWRWRLQVRIPDAVTSDHLRAARRSARRKGTDVSGVRRTTWREGPAVQVLHIGPYDKVGGSYEALDRYAGEHGMRCVPPGHEIYISDPRRTAPDRLKTIVRMPVRRARRSAR